MFQNLSKLSNKEPVLSFIWTNGRYFGYHINTQLNGSYTDKYWHKSTAKFHTHLHHAHTNSSSPNSTPSTLQPMSENQMVLKKKIPRNFVADTYLPHLENQIAQHIHALMPVQIVQLTTAYSKLPSILRNTTLAKKLSDQIKFRISGFRANEAIEVLFPMYKMLPNEISLFQEIADHLSLPHIFSNIQTLQLIGVVRVYAKLQPKFESFLEKVIPKLRKELSGYDTTELSDVLTSIAEFSRHSSSSNDIELLAILLPEIERKYNETSLLHSITNLSSLCKLKIFHKAFIDRLTKDLSEPLRIRNLPPKYISRICWTYSKFGLLDDIIQSISPLIENNIDRFSPIEFSKICQALPDDSQLPLKICSYLNSQISDFSRSDFLAFFLGCVNRGFFPLEDGTVSSSQITEFNNASSSNSLSIEIDRTKLLQDCLGYISAEEDNFSENEANILISLLLYTPQYQYLLLKLSPVWDELIKDISHNLNINIKIK